MATLVAPMNDLRRQGVKFEWSQQCATSFAQLKHILVSPQVVLTHYDPKLPLIVQCDASPVGIRAVLSHQMPDGSDRPVAFASRTLIPAERNYAQIEREGLSLVFGLTWFHQYTYGRRFILRSDHKPLVHIFGSKCGIPVTVASRIQRWAIKLQCYSYNLQYIPAAANGNADGLSRLPIPGLCTDATEKDSLPLNQVWQIAELPFDFSMVAVETAKDPLLSKCIRFAQRGWPDHHPKDPDLQPFCSRRMDLSVDSGCLLKGPELVIPSSLREKVLSYIHSGHHGTSRMKMFRRERVWWLSINAHIEAKRKQCQGCNETANQRPDDSRRNSWLEPGEPWERIHLDFARQLQENCILYWLMQDQIGSKLPS